MVLLECHLHFRLEPLDEKCGVNLCLPSLNWLLKAFLFKSTRGCKPPAQTPACGKSQRQLVNGWMDGWVRGSILLLQLASTQLLLCTVSYLSLGSPVRSHSLSLVHRPPVGVRGVHKVCAGMRQFLLTSRSATLSSWF